jgi:hypothetical protein
MVRATENQIAFAILQFLDTLPTGEATVFAIKKNLPNFITLSALDRQKSQTRKREELWEQQVRNIKSHSSTSGNYINSGFLSHRPRRLAITTSGRKHLAGGNP